jgi:hypothetical protein
MTKDVVPSPPKPMNSRHQIIDSPISRDREVLPPAPPRKKSKRSDANKGIQIAENPRSPARDDVSFSELSCISLLSSFYSNLLVTVILFVFFSQVFSRCWPWPPALSGFETRPLNSRVKTFTFSSTSFFS